MVITRYAAYSMRTLYVAGVITIGDDTTGTVVPGDAADFGGSGCDIAGVPAIENNAGRPDAPGDSANPVMRINMACVVASGDNAALIEARYAAEVVAVVATAPDYAGVVAVDDGAVIRTNNAASKFFQTEYLAVTQAIFDESGVIAGNRPYIALTHDKAANETKIADRTSHTNTTEQADVRAILVVDI